MKAPQLKIHEQVFEGESGRLSSAIQPSIGDFAVTPRSRGCTARAAGQSAIGSRARERRGLSSAIPKTL